MYRVSISPASHTEIMEPDANELEMSAEELSARQSKKTWLFTDLLTAMKYGENLYSKYPNATIIVDHVGAIDTGLWETVYTLKNMR